MVANFKTPDAQRRLLTAVIAAHPDLKLNFKAIAQHFGPDDWSKDGIEHFFRPLKKDALVVRAMVKSGQPAKEFFDNKAWQFRGIKRDAEAMRQGKGAAAGTGSGSSVPATPKGRKRVATSAPSTGKSTATKRARASASKPAAAAAVITVDDDGEDDEDNPLPPIPLDTPTHGPRFTDFGAKQFWGGNHDAQAPALDTTQAESPTEEDDIKPHTPSDAAAFSFSQAVPSSTVGIGAYNLDAYPISQPSFAPGSSYIKNESFAADEYIDDEV
ncbi:polarity defective-2 [Diaporthe helianthi]|uniref:Polarity defective-2 n=1 Tax=Diaporthe helianthi TaxID=158607 RepID=A0A2P5I5V3_DIAHE|nr:polarity defective-2 [Diaporthe helianthi]